MNFDLGWTSPLVWVPAICLVLMALSNRCRAVCNEIFGHYVLHALRDLIKYGWRLALVATIYTTIYDGSLENLVKAIHHIPPAE